MYNHSLFSADRATHFKIVLVPLVLGSLLAVAVANVRPGATDAGARAQAIVLAKHGPAHYAADASDIVR